MLTSADSKSQTPLNATEFNQNLRRLVSVVYRKMFQLLFNASGIQRKASNFNTSNVPK